MTENSRCYDGTLFLEDIEEKLRQRLDQLNKELDEGQKEIENMHELLLGKLYGDGPVRI